MRALFYLLLFLVVLSCESSKYPGFSEVSSDLFYQRIQLGEGISYHPDSCFVDYSVSYYPVGKENKKISSSIKFAQFSDAFLKDSILKDAKEGDILNFISNKHNIYIEELCMANAENDTSFYFIEFQVDKVYNLFAQSEDPNVVEFKKLEQFFNNKLDKSSYSYFNGIWIKRIPVNTESSKKLTGEIVLDYAGYSLKGEEWDIPDHPLKFNIKDKFQVIRGIELALQQMHYGDSIHVIVPSYLAFGELGSKSGNIPPYNSIQYNLKVYDAAFYQDSIRATIE